MLSLRAALLGVAFFVTAAPTSALPIEETDKDRLGFRVYSLPEVDRIIMGILL